ncbi:hypothetical protein N7512_000377 [Penicillium capsulatum]|nr:hypothetical protein N7512_000377 [Penicillium capsulatum]
MTRLRGASFESPQKAQPVGGERSQYCRTKAPPNAPDVVLQNTIEVSDPSRVLPWYRDERRRRFNTLVRRISYFTDAKIQDAGPRPVPVDGDESAKDHIGGIPSSAHEPLLATSPA